jgi:hypothetical protein
MAENSDKSRFPVVREAVASFADKEDMRRAVGQLLAAGFEPDDLSVLATHESLEVAGGVPGYRGKPGASLFAGLTDEVSFIAPLTLAGFVLVSGGSVAVTLAALVSAGLGGAALKELLDYVIANRHSSEFAAAQGGRGAALGPRRRSRARGDGGAASRRSGRPACAYACAAAPSEALTADRRT